MIHNKFLLEFNLGGPEVIHSASWITERLELENQYRKWCKERISEDEGFPHWQFSTHYVYTSSLTSSGTDEVMIAEGIYIFDDEARAAFKLTFQL